MDLKDKSASVAHFEKVKKLWDKRDILIVEGENSCSGVGNDLFDNAQSVERIICPSRNVYSKVKDIQEAIDLGHIDSEYEWFKMGATSKVKFSHKHTQSIILIKKFS